MKPIKLESTLFLDEKEFDEIRHRIISNKVINVICTGLEYSKVFETYKLTINMEVIN